MAQLASSISLSPARDQAADPEQARSHRAGFPACLLQGWHLLSLDAPCVAVTWTAAFAWSAHRVPSMSTLLAMFAAVWMLYAADRLLDARAPGLMTQPIRTPELQPRHLMHRRHATLFLAALGLCGILLLTLLHAVPAALLQAEAMLAVLLVLWLGLVHLLQIANPGASARLPKEVLVGVFFAAATSLPALLSPARPTHGLLMLVVLFGGLCATNCLLINHWEQVSDQHGKQTSGLGRAARLPSALVAVLAGLVAGAGTVALVSVRDTHVSALALALTLAAILLGTLQHFRSRLQPTTLRAAADLVLLTPLPLLLWRR